jgi:ABC-2 type transport system permease protein
MNILILELKKYLYDCKKILIFLIMGMIISIFIFHLSNEIIKRESLVQPFQIGLVDNDSSLETNMLINIFNENYEMNKIFKIVKMQKSEAESSLKEFPAYIEIPENFSSDIKVGLNSPFKIVANLEKPLQVAITKIIAKAGVIYLSTTQAGIYSVIDFALKNGMDYTSIENTIIYPINLSYALSMINYNALIDTKIVSPVGSNTIGMHYLISFFTFFTMINMICLTKTLTEALNKNILAMYKIAGISLLKALLIQLSTLFIINVLICIPFIFVFGYKSLIVSLCFSSFTIMCVSLFEIEMVSNIYIFSCSIIMLFLSGGIIPLVFLPSIFGVLKFFTINYWILNLNTDFVSGIAMIALSIIFFTSAYVKKSFSY